jgi:hypothetical protein
LTFSTATTLALQAVATSVAPVTAVEYLANGKSIGVVTNPAETLEWTPPLVGSYEIHARSLNATGTVSVSSGVPVEFLLGEAQARFLGVDDQTKGNWLQAYGTNGVVMAGASWTFPGYVSSFAFSNAATWVWTATTLDERALVAPDQSGRIAGTIHAWGPELSFDLTLADGKPHLLALYFLDWDELGREMDLELRDAVSGALLDQRSVGGFGSGRYLIWEVSGPVRVIARSYNWIGPVIGGVFLSTPDGVEAPLLNPGTTLFESALAVSLEAPPGAVVRYTLDGSDPDGSAPVYTGTLELTGSSRVRARAFRPGWRSSPLVGGDYWKRPRIAGLTMDPGQVTLQFSGEAGRTYVVETSTNLFDWTPLVTNLPLTEVMQLSVTNLPDASQRFFRSRLAE